MNFPQNKLFAGLKSCIHFILVAFFQLFGHNFPNIFEKEKQIIKIPYKSTSECICMWCNIKQHRMPTMKSEKKKHQKRPKTQEHKKVPKIKGKKTEL